MGQKNGPFGRNGPFQWPILGVARSIGPAGRAHAEARSEGRKQWPFQRAGQFNGLTHEAKGTAAWRAAHPDATGRLSREVRADGLRWPIASSVAFARRSASSRDHQRSWVGVPVDNIASSLRRGQFWGHARLFNNFSFAYSMSWDSYSHPFTGTITFRYIYRGLSNSDRGCRKPAPACRSADSPRWRWARHRPPGDWSSAKAGAEHSARGRRQWRAQLPLSCTECVIASLDAGSRHTA